MGNQQATQSELGWLAGIIDGEGYLGMIISSDKRAYEGAMIDVQLHICNTDEAIILKAQEIFRKLGVNPYIRVSKMTKSKKDVFKIQIKHFAKLKRVLEVLHPYLTGNKQERAGYVMQFIDLRMSNEGVRNPNIGNGKRGCGRVKPYTEEELELYDRCRPLQERGASETTRQDQRKSSEIWKVMEDRKRSRQLQADKI